MSEVPEITERDMERAVLRIDGKPISKDRIFAGMVLDPEVLDDFKQRSGEDYRELINATLKAAALQGG